MDTKTSSSYFVSRFLFRVLVVVGFVCFMFFGSLVSGGRTVQTTSTTTKLDDEQVDVVGNHDAQLDFNYMSKRRVPNGPDPIHNRRAGNSGRPPGQS
ncbi:CLAVATA3/ESR (CLE)-related protein 25-like [Vicia villosa]|uniref:CLAVATA3/ESR (CLE)-related protein 25-like n=1 Tax=Vicia villosa TaxID=3911 RepID=UPI00273BA42E|nr:CLAVATA3/ESR (CLE)-related protein 25-like [Vicia villosa]